MKSFDRFSAILLGIISCLLGFNVIWILTHHADYLWSFRIIIWLVFLPLAYISIVLYAFWQGASARAMVAVATFSCGVALYMAEFLLIQAGPHMTLPRDFDRRSKLQVVLDMRSTGQNAFPSVHPKSIMPSSLKIHGAELVPLGGIPRVTTVFCNEIGEYYIYESDEFGFTNPLGLYAQPVDVALVGDSFTQGFCAPSGESYAERIRRKVPRTLNLGNNGNGPLLELAGIREFLPSVKPQYVFWIYFEGNDMEDLSRELVHPILKRYLLDSQFSQHLIKRVSDYDIALREFVEKGVLLETSRSSVGRRLDDFPEQFRLWSRLWHIRALAGLTDLKRQWLPRRWNPEVTEEEVELAMDQILKESKSLVESWGGRLVVVYLPSYHTFGYGVSHPWREQVLGLVQKNQIESIDLLPVFAEYPDPVSLFNFRKEAHYTSQGNELVMREIVSYLNTQRFPLASESLSVAADRSHQGL